MHLIVSIDKDLDQINGPHYNYRSGEFYYVSIEEANKSFWRSMLTGDTADNIKGIYGIGPVKAEKILDESSDWEQTVREMYEKEGLDYNKNFYLLKLLEE